MEFLIGVITGICLILAVGTALKRSGRKGPRPSPSRVMQTSKNLEVDNQVREKLISMLGGDKDKAAKLAARMRFGKAGRYSETYYWRLAIRELEMEDDNG